MYFCHGCHGNTEKKKQDVGSMYTGHSVIQLPEYNEKIRLHLVKPKYGNIKESLNMLQMDQCKSKTGLSPPIVIIAINI